MNYCPKCGSLLNQGEAFCKICGAEIPLPQNNFINTTQNVNASNEQYPSFEQQPSNYTLQNFNQIPNNELANNNSDMLIDAYIGENADLLKKGGFSTNTFLFGYTYLFYRKMWSLGLIWLVVGDILLFLPYKITVIFLAFLNIYFSFQFKELYLKHVKKQVEKIKMENPDKTNEELLNLCKKKGGTTIIPVIIEIILSGLAFWIYIILILGMFA